MAARNPLADPVQVLVALALRPLFSELKSGNRLKLLAGKVLFASKLALHHPILLHNWKAG